MYTFSYTVNSTIVQVRGHNREIAIAGVLLDKDNYNYYSYI